MGSYLIKQDPESDLFVLWSTIVHNPTWWGTRQEIMTMPFTELGFRFGQTCMNQLTKALERCENSGSSLMDGGEGYGENLFTPLGSLRRELLNAFCKLIDAGKEAEAQGLLIPHDSEDNTEESEEEEELTDERRIVTVWGYSDDVIEVRGESGGNDSFYSCDVVMDLDPYKVRIGYDGRSWKFAFYDTKKSEEMDLRAVTFEEVVE